jgi:hypothetical protein
MFSTCIFCHAGLGKNEAIEHFPVGRRLAYDAAKGRLWAVCRSCERWNLSPLEERWEAIEECERLFRETKLRVSTDNIGLARLKEGTTLVRVGEPQRPEMAAWRYGDQFHRRRRKHYTLVAAGAVAVGGFVIAGPVMGLLGAGSVNLVNLPNMLNSLRPIAKVPVNGKVLRLNRPMLNKVRLVPLSGGGFELTFPHFGQAVNWFGLLKPGVALEGDAALRAARHLLPRINRAGGSPVDVAEAVRVLEATPDSASLFGRFARMSASERHGASNLSGLRAPVRLALEMSLHEEDERRALEGELADLEDRWREAEEVAAIADDLFQSPAVTALLSRLKGRRG